MCIRDSSGEDPPVPPDVRAPSPASRLGGKCPLPCTGVPDLRAWTGQSRAPCPCSASPHRAAPR
eukprot:10211890-Alexandrium_andersonii.AAC.1